MKWTAINRNAPNANLLLEQPRLCFYINSNSYFQNNQILTQTKIKTKHREREREREKERERENVIDNNKKYIENNMRRKKY